MKVPSAKKILIILLLTALGLFLFTDVVSGISGIKLFLAGLFNDGAVASAIFLFAILFILAPLFAFLFISQEGKTMHIIGSACMFIPIIWLNINSSNGGIENSDAITCYTVISIIMLMIAFISKDEDEDYEVEEESNETTETAKAITEQERVIEKKVVIVEEKNEESIKPKFVKFEEQVQQFSDERLNEIIEDAPIYNPDLVTCCEMELKLRKEYLSILPVARKKSSQELQKIINNPTLYKPAMIYCCHLVLKERAKKDSEEETIIEL